MLISVIVPAYNVEKYLKKCLDSPIHQTWKKMEIILVDDGSTDSSGMICDAYAEKDTRIRVVHQSNGGLSDARNTGLALCRGEYLGFVDSDDWIAPDMYEVLVAYEQNLACIKACYPESIPAGEYRLYMIYHAILLMLAGRDDAYCQELAGLIRKNIFRIWRNACVGWKAKVSYSLIVLNVHWYFCMRCRYRGWTGKTAE